MTKNQLDIAQIVQLQDGQQRGEEIQGSHPVHGSNTGENFAINTEKNTWHCFRHNTGGGPLSYIAVEEGIISCDEAGPGVLTGDRYVEAAKAANEKYNAGIDLDDQSQEQYKRRERALKVLDTATELSQGQLTDEQVEQICERRQLDKEDVEEYRIGYFNDTVDEALRLRFEDRSLIDSGLYGEDDGEIFPVLRNRVVIPYIEYGRVKFIIGRRTSKEQDAKYKKTRQTRYNDHILWQELEDRNELIITEGIFDAISVAKAGYNVVSPATTKFRQQDIDKVLKKAQQFDKVYIANDADEGGKDGAEDTAQTLTKAGIEPQLVELPEGEDLDDWTTKNGYDLSRILEDAESYLDKLVKEAQNAGRVKRSKLVDEILDLIAGWDSVNRDYVLNELPGRKSALEEQLRKIQDSATERAERTELSEPGSSTVPEGDEEVSDWSDLDVEETDYQARLNGKLDDGTFFMILPLRHQSTTSNFALKSDGSIERVKNRYQEKKTVFEAAPNLDPEELDQERLDYDYFKHNGNNIRLQHKIPQYNNLDIYTPDNGIKKYLDPNTPEAPGSKVYDRIRDKIRTYWDHHSTEWFDVLTAYAIHTYLIMPLGKTVYIMFKGREDTGKSTAQKILARLTYNGFFTGKTTPAVSSRLAHFKQATIHQDEFEKIGEEQKNKIQGVYNTGQRKGGKYTFTNTNKQDPADQIESLHSFCAKTLSVNSLHGFESNFLSRNIIIETTRTNRTIQDIETVEKEEEDDFADTRNETAAYCLMNHSKIIEDVQEYHSTLSSSGRSADKLGIICGIVEHFKGPRRAHEVRQHLTGNEALQSDDIQDKHGLTLTYVVNEFGADDKRIHVKPKEVADFVNTELGYDGDYQVSSRGIGNVVRELGLVRKESQATRKSSSGGYVYEIPRQHAIEACERADMFDLRDKLTIESSSGDATESPSTSGTVDDPGSESSVRSERSEGSPEITMEEYEAAVAESSTENVITNLQNVLHGGEDEGDLREIAKHVEDELDMDASFVKQQLKEAM